jgi:hypothetical protein
MAMKYTNWLCKIPNGYVITKWLCNYQMVINIPNVFFWIPNSRSNTKWLLKYQKVMKCVNIVIIRPSKLYPKWGSGMLIYHLAVLGQPSFAWLIWMVVVYVPTYLYWVFILLFVSLYLFCQPFCNVGSVLEVKSTHVFERIGESLNSIEENTKHSYRQNVNSVYIHVFRDPPIVLSACRFKNNRAL